MGNLRRVTNIRGICGFSFAIGIMLFAESLMAQGFTMGQYDGISGEVAAHTAVIFGSSAEFEASYSELVIRSSNENVKDEVEGLLSAQVNKLSVVIWGVDVDAVSSFPAVLTRIDELQKVLNSDYMINPSSI